MTAPAHIGRAAALRRVGLFLLFLVGALLLSAGLSVILADLLRDAEGGLGGWLMEKGPSKIFRRILLLLAVPALLVLIRSLGWRGVNDSGWRADGAPGIDPRWWRDLLSGLLFGLVSILCLVGLSFAGGARAADPNHYLPGEPGYIVWFAAAALVIGVFEETLARGVLFRVAARIWGAWPAALVISLVFAYAHYLKPEAAAFEEGGWLERTTAVTLSALTGCTRVDDAVWRMANTALMSVFLCFLVQRSGTVWLAAGAHAGWVWVIKVNGKFTDVARDASPPAWAPIRPDAIDSPVTAVVLVLMVVGVLVFRPRAEPPRTPG